MYDVLWKLLSWGKLLAKFEGYPANIGIINMKLTSRLYILSAID